MSDSEEVVAIDDDDSEQEKNQDERGSSEDPFDSTTTDDERGGRENSTENDYDDEDENTEHEDQDMGVDDESTEAEDNDTEGEEDDSDDMEIQEVVIEESSNEQHTTPVKSKQKQQEVVQEAQSKTSQELNPDPLSAMEVEQVKETTTPLPKQQLPTRANFFESSITESTLKTSTPTVKDRSENLNVKQQATFEHTAILELPPSPVMEHVEDLITVPKNILSTARFDVRVSSVLNKATKQCGKMFMFDGKEETHWSSDQGSTQFISLFFQVPQKMTEFKIQFQGGFSAQQIRLIIETTDPATGFSESFYPKDSIQIQRFKLKRTVEEMVSALFIFEESSDFFGRIVVYTLEIFD